ncbi:MAG: bifunctional UDP-N-acetylmuramoyl-tripeptide:D-alanyl-D-alanine ligase/alanine racemase [Flavobacteriales bacterium]|nr:bifunctional UDP-N-acetylmuramoyl-tripeptide:D-alanyl-D-alanine ligase/alanine racemase [Flavobacteriales bacterium]
MANKQYFLREVAQVLNADLKGENEEIVDNISIDSRISGNNSKTLFFALITENNDGHKYISDAIKKGVRSFIVNHFPNDMPEYCSFIIVDDTLKALQKLATWRRDNSKLKTIAITGSNGKTIVKEWLYQLLNKDFNIVRSPKSYNSQIGVALSVLEIKEENNIGIFEAGISKTDEMDILENIIQPQLGIFTNIGRAHSENFSSEEQKIKEKIKLFKNCEQIFFKDDDKIGELIKSSPLLHNVEKISWATSKKADLQVLGIMKHKNSSIITGLYKGELSTIEIPFSDDASIENAIITWLIMLSFAYKKEEIKKRFSKLIPIEMRLQQIEGNNNCTIINDGYNLDIDSLKIALNFLDTQFQHKKRAIIISTIKQHSDKADSIYTEIARLIEQHNIDKLVLLGDEINKFKEKFTANTIFSFENTNQLISGLSSINFNDEIVLLKGARSFRLERVVKHLSKKSHDTVLEINLSSIVRNLNFFRSQLNPETKLMVMVKAFSYGGGSYEIANILQYHNVDYLAVAYADEGKLLREAGIKTPILVLNPEISSYETLIEYSLEPEIYSIRVLNEFLKVLGDRKFSIHIKIDTGMHRLGFSEHDIHLLSDILNENINIEVKSIFSHLSSADDLLEEEFTKSQAEQLLRLSKLLSLNINKTPIIHLLNSIGIINYPQYQFDMVRIGLGLHGITNNKETQHFLEPVTKLKTVISQIRNIEKGESVGYNRAFIADKKSIIATIPIGYADGIDRRWGKEVGYIIINNNKAKIIGIIAMDMMMVDISGIDCEEGDEVEIFGNVITVNEIADKINTIPYEILTKISPRVKRIYFQE